MKEKKIGEEKGKLKKKKIGEIIFNVISKLIKYLLIIIGILLILYSLIYNLINIISGEKYIQLGNIGIVTVDDDSSMKPEIKSSQLLITYKNNPNQNDIITYSANGEIKIQRVYRKYNDNGEEYIVTKGDNNLNVNIDEIANDDVIGIVVAKIPIIGFLAKIMQIKFVALLIIIAILFQIMYVIRNRKNNGKRFKSKE